MIQIWQYVDAYRKDNLPCRLVLYLESSIWSSPKTVRFLARPNLSIQILQVRLYSVTADLQRDLQEP